MSAQHRAAAHIRWARTTDRSQATRAARQAFEAKFVTEARRMHPGAPESTIVSVAESLRRAYFARLAAASAKARH